MKEIDGIITVFERELKSLSLKYEEEKRTLFGDILNVLSEFAIVLDDFNIKYANAAAAKLFEEKVSEDLLGKCALDYIDFDYIEQFEDCIRTVTTDGSCNYFQSKIRTAKGGSFLLEMEATVFTFGNTEFVILFGHNSMPQIDLKLEMLDLEGRFRDLMYKSTDGYILLDVVGHDKYKIIDLNFAFEKMIGLSKKYCVDKNLDELLPIYGLEKILPFLENCTRTASEVHSDGASRFCYSLSPVVSSGGDVTKIYCRFWTTQKQRPGDLSVTKGEVALGMPSADDAFLLDTGFQFSAMPNRSVVFFDFILNNVTEMVFVRSQDKLSYVFANELACTTLGYSQQELLGLSIFDLEPNLTGLILEENMRIQNKYGSVIYDSVFLGKNNVRMEAKVTSLVCTIENNIFVVNFVRAKCDDQQISSNDDELKLFMDGPNVAYKVRFVEGWPAEYISRNVNQWFGYLPEDITSGDVSPMELIHPDDAERVNEEIGQFLISGVDSFEQEYRLLCKNGDYVWVRDFTFVIRNEEGEVIYLNGYMSDISEQKRRYDALIQAEIDKRQSELHFQEIFNNSFDGILFVELQGQQSFRLLEVNRRFDHISGCRISSCVGSLLEDLKEFEILVKINERIRACHAKGRVCEELLELIRGNKKRLLHAVYLPVRDSLGSFYRVLVMIRDITDQRRMKHELELSQILISDTENVASIGHFYYEKNAISFHCSKGIFHILGLPHIETVTEDIDLFKYVQARDLQYLQKFIDLTFETTEKQAVVFRILTTTGVYKTVRCVLNIVSDPGKADVLLGIMQDVTDFYTLQEKVTIEEEKLRMIVENSPIGIFVLMGLQPQYVNNALLDMCNVHSMSDFVTIEPLSLIFSEDRTILNRLLGRIRKELSNATSVYQLTVRTNEIGGLVRVLDLRFVACLMDGSYYLQIMVIDITEEMERERLMNRLASDTLYINKKKHVIKSVREEVNHLMHKSEYKKNDFKRIAEILDVYSKDESDWELFNDYFDQLHPEFIANLKIIAPELSENDIKHCACIRLNIDTKQIARLFNVVPASIQTSRVRLKKKLNLPESVDLRTFIQSI